jgi:transcriptional regulator with XRE-family HTH domain
MGKKTLGLKLLELRQQHNLTQKQLCEELNLGRSTYSYFETGRRTPDIDTLLLIAQYYNISIEELVPSSKTNLNNSLEQINDSFLDIKIIHHLKSKHIPIENVQEMTKADFDFLMDYKRLTEENKAELQYIMNYKLRKQTS